MTGQRALAVTWIDTPIDLMVAVGDERALYALEYAERDRERSLIERLSESLKTEVLPGKTAATERLASELAGYFRGEQRPFTVPLVRRIDQMPALRAVAQAIGDNPFAVVIPCHRVINTGGKLGGYGGGLERKRWLLEHEQRMIGSAEKFELT